MEKYQIANTVAVIQVKPSYPQQAPFHPVIQYQEYQFPEVSNEANQVYDGIRAGLLRLELDSDNYNTKNWNPLGRIISHGDTVVIKPNMVKESHLTKLDDYEYVITHGSVIRAICDYAIIALKNKGKIIFADSPETDANFDLICERNGLKKIIEFYKSKLLNIDFKLIDLRKEQWVKEDGVIVKKWELPGDPGGYTIIPLNENSEFISHASNQDYYGATFDKAETQKHHHGSIHEYLISSSVLTADVIINIPKLKTHKKSGLTCCLKNLVGIIGDKNWLPHHTEGTPHKGGDQFANNSLASTIEHSLLNKIKQLAKDNDFINRTFGKWKKVGRFIFGSTEQVVRSGNWYGNDTVWRMILDLNKAIFFFDSQGNLQRKPKKIICIVDAILAGEKMGPLHPDCKDSGLLLLGFDPAATDRVCAEIMGFDFRKIPTIQQAFLVKKLPFVSCKPNDISIVSNKDNIKGKIGSFQFNPSWRFEPHFGWKGHVELPENKK
ncbi:MAG: DUF362 domain-containing protein [Chlorobium sp.]|nr:DUF362 domain-containing protein [Chlorobium sp.]